MTQPLLSNLRGEEVFQAKLFHVFFAFATFLLKELEIKGREDEQNALLEHQILTCLEHTMSLHTMYSNIL